MRNPMQLQTRVLEQTQALITPTAVNSTVSQLTNLSKVDSDAQTSTGGANNMRHGITAARVKYEALISQEAPSSKAKPLATRPLVPTVPTLTSVRVLSLTEQSQAQRVVCGLNVLDMLADERFLPAGYLQDRQAVERAALVLRTLVEGVRDVAVLASNTHGYTVMGINLLVTTTEGVVLGVQANHSVAPTALAFLKYIDSLLVGYTRTKKCVRTAGKKAKLALTELLTLEAVDLTLAEENALLVLGVAVRKQGVLELKARL